MRLSYSLGSLLTVEQVLACSRKLNELKPDTVWIPETWGMENFSMLSMASKENSFSKIGSSIVNIYSRSPSLIAMGAATVDTISNKAALLIKQLIVPNFFLARGIIFSTCFIFFKSALIKAAFTEFSSIIFFKFFALKDDLK